MSTFNQGLEGERELEADAALPRFFFFTTPTSPTSVISLPNTVFFSNTASRTEWPILAGRQSKGKRNGISGAWEARTACHEGGLVPKFPSFSLSKVQSHPVKAQEHCNLISVMHYGPQSNTQNFYVFRYDLRYAWSGKHKNYSILHVKRNESGL